MKLDGLTHPKALAHADVQKLIESRKAQRVYLLIDNNGRCHGHLREPMNLADEFKIDTSQFIDVGSPGDPF